MAATYTPIASITLGATASSIVFSSIPSTYTDLVLVTELRGSDTTSDAYFRFNTDSGSNYSDTILRGNGSTASSVRDTGAIGIDLGVLATSSSASGVFVPSVIHIMNYANTTTNKTCLIRTSNAGSTVSLIAGLWRSTAAINTININHRGAGWASGSTANLYGILGANA